MNLGVERIDAAGVNAHQDLARVRRGFGDGHDTRGLAGRVRDGGYHHGATTRLFQNVGWSTLNPVSPMTDPKRLTGR
jgi:hypothetical protein